MTVEYTGRTIMYTHNRNFVCLLVQLKNKAAVKSNARFNFNQGIKKTELA